MTYIDLYCNGATATAKVHGQLTAEMVGVKVYLHTDSAWDNLFPKMVARAAEVEIPMAISQNESEVPHECLISGTVLYLGIDGWDEDGTIRIPTTWAPCAIVYNSAAVTDEEKPTPELIDQLIAVAGKTDKALTDFTEKVFAPFKETVEGKLNVIGDSAEEATKEWLSMHPEATTSVQDGSITANKIQGEFLKSIKNAYVTPQMYGAAADGISDDTDAMAAALHSGYIVVLDGTYRIRPGVINVTADAKCIGFGGRIVVDAYQAVPEKGYNSASAITVQTGKTFQVVGVTFASAQLFVPQENLKEDVSATTGLASNVAFVSASGGNVVITDCSFDRGTIGKYVDASSVSIRGSKLTNGEHGMFASGGTTIDIDGLDMGMSNSMGGTLYHALYCAPCGESTIRGLRVKSNRQGAELKFNNNAAYAGTAAKVLIFDSKFDAPNAEGLVNVNCNALELRGCDIRCERLGRVSDAGTVSVIDCTIQLLPGTAKTPVCLPAKIKVANCRIKKSGTRRLTEANAYISGCNFVFDGAAEQEIGYSAAEEDNHITFWECEISADDMSGDNQYVLNAARIDTRYINCSFAGKNMGSGWKCTRGKVLLGNCYFDDCVPTISKLSDTTLVFDILGSDGEWHSSRGTDV